MNSGTTRGNSKDQWKIETNDRYQKVVSTVMGLATGSLILPVFFLRNILSIPQDKPLVSYYRHWSLRGSLASLFLSIVFGTVFFYMSAKWVKHAWRQKTSFSGKQIETILDIAFWLQIVCFLIGISLFLYFAVYEVSS